MENDFPATVVRPDGSTRSVRVALLGPGTDGMPLYADANDPPRFYVRHPSRLGLTLLADDDPRIGTARISIAAQRRWNPDES